MSQTINNPYIDQEMMTFERKIVKDHSTSLQGLTAFTEILYDMR